MRKRTKTERGRAGGVISLDDLVPRKDPKGGSGGSGKAVFGGGPIVPGSDVEDREPRKPRREK
jgi:hypothetical protein